MDPVPIAGAERTILIVDDEPTVRQALARALRRERLNILSAANAAEGLRILESHDPTPEVVISDFKMPGMDGVTFLGQVRARWPAVQRILLTGFADVAALERAINETEVFRFVSKPWDDAVLLSAVRSAVQEFSLREENERLLRLSQEQNRALAELNKELEARVDARTRAVERAKRDWEVTFDSIVDPVSIIGLDFKVKRSNRAFARHAGEDVRAVPGRKCYAVLARERHPCKGCPVEQVLQNRQASCGEVRDRHQDRTFQVWAFPILEGEAEGEIRNLVCYYRDVTGEKELQQRLIQTEKMAAVGQLAGGVAHEINNPLGGVLAFTQLLLREVPKDHEHHEYLAEIEASALRCKRIVESLLKFSRRSPGTERAAVQLNEVIQSTVFLVEHQFQLKSVQIDRELDPGLWWVKANANQLSQVLLNLLTNAFGAMPNGGTIRIRSWNDEDHGLVKVSVSDTGSGIARKHLSKIFEPFFTTKGEGQGTGLGLTITLDIVQAHGGTIEVDSVEGKGSTFTLSFPALRAPVAPDAPAPEEET